MAWLADLAGALLLCFLLGLPALMWFSAMARRMADDESERWLARPQLRGALLGWLVGALVVVAGFATGTVPSDAGGELYIAPWMLLTTAIGWAVGRPLDGSRP